MIRLVIASIVTSVALSNAALASSIHDFTGRWKGETISSPDDKITPERLSIEIKAAAGGFELFWNDLMRDDGSGWTTKPIEARFIRTDREGVFEYVPETGSFLDRMFASPLSGNPLDGETLLWARIDADMLAVYSLTVGESGRFGLDHYSWTRTEDGLTLRYREQTEQLGEEALIEGKLVPEGE